MSLSTPRTICLLFRNALVATVYFALAALAFRISRVEENLTLIWPLGGLALAVFLRYGWRMSPGIFVGALTAGVFSGYGWPVSVGLALGHTLEPLAAFWLLSRVFEFRPDLPRLTDYLALIGAGAAIAPLFGTTLDIAALSLEGALPETGLTERAWYEWLSDAGSVMLITPLLLLCNAPALRPWSARRLLEAVLLWGVCLLTGAMLLAGWRYEALGNFARLYLLMPPLIWVAVRFGQRHVATLIPLLAAEGLVGAMIGQGYFAADIASTGLTGYWMYILVLAAIGMALATLTTDAQSTHSLLRESEARQRSFVVHAGHGLLLVDPTTLTIQEANPHAARLLGYSPDELSGKPIQTLSTAVDELRKLVKSTVDSGVRLTAEIVFCHRDGNRLTLETSGAPLQWMGNWGLLLNLYDISQRKRDEQALKLAAQVFDHSSEGILITDASNHIVSVNHAFTHVTGYRPEEVIGRDPGLLSSGNQDGAFYRRMWKNILETGLWSGEIWNRRRDGEIYPEWLSISVVRDESGAIVNHIGIFSDISERKQLEDRMRYLAEHDFLTGLPNRLLLLDRVGQALALARRHGTCFAVLFLDLDHFKEVNDRLGHHVGDELLREVARRLATTVRATDTVCRQGGDEFVILLAEISDNDVPTALAKKIIAAIAQPYRIEDHALDVTTSVGFAVYPEDGDNADTLLKHADTAMYAAKRSGRNAWKRFGPSRP